MAETTLTHTPPIGPTMAGTNSLPRSGIDAPATQQYDRALLFVHDRKDKKNDDYLCWMWSRFKIYLSKLNWSGFIFMLLLCMIGVTGNDNVSSIQQWLFMVVVFGIPISCFFLFAGKDD
jgi:hypothetical protein